MAAPFKRGMLALDSPVVMTLLCSEMQVSQQEMADAQVPLNLRDYCAHLFIPLMKCRLEHYYLPWHCKAEKHKWEDCQYQEWVHYTYLVMPHLILSMHSYLDRVRQKQALEKAKRQWTTPTNSPVDNAQ